ncbi:MAG: P-loop NTPase [Clostridia bacterium]|nr:P-loop NTPase [Clostridia bacterium]
MSASVVMIASCKGGVGKTTITAAIGAALAALGRRTLMIDCDFGMRCLDLVTGMTDVTYDICDCILRDIPIEKAVQHDPDCEKLMFLAAPYRYEGGLTADNFRDFLRQAVKTLELDYILLDTHGGEGVELPLAAAVADLALVVTTQQQTSVRAAEETALRLGEMGVTQTRLIVNCYDRRSVKRGVYPNVIGLIDNTKVRLIGVVPNDEKLRFGLHSEMNAETVRVFFNIARRIHGESVPLSVV